MSRARRTERPGGEEEGEVRAVHIHLGQLDDGAGKAVLTEGPGLQDDEPRVQGARVDELHRRRRGGDL